ncbi:Hypothetical_protein [Hexamita inflata]|uniref:Hypothetical_protein n=1 Tax=Hexamita inflata TaxID=28002 RepID=A0AA86QMD1_9EUKA|nr:Hypothetical protein HINF_LOCUS49924 [Hexamita inflata]
MSETKLSCNIKLMKGTRYMINFHNQNKDLIEQQLKTKTKIVKMGFEITKQNWKQFLKKFEKNKLEDILKKVEQQLRALKNVKEFYQRSSLLFFWSDRSIHEDLVCIDRQSPLQSLKLTMIIYI